MTQQYADQLIERVRVIEKARFNEAPAAQERHHRLDQSCWPRTSDVISDRIYTGAALRPISRIFLVREEAQDRWKKCSARCARCNFDHGRSALIVDDGDDRVTRAEIYTD